MKEIRFRGQRTDNGELVEGFYISHANVVHYIIPAPVGGYEDSRGGFYVGEFHQVDPATIELMTPEPHQLTLDELRQMDGQPVWIEIAGNVSCRVMLKHEAWPSESAAHFKFTDNSSILFADDYGKTWTAYDRPPGGDRL